jgi:ubiquinone/menaquinone biosynthesis C-methylase UbiE
MLDMLASRPFLPQNPYLPRSIKGQPRELSAWARYLLLHEAIRLPLIGGHRLASMIAKLWASRQTPARNRALERAVQQRYWALLEQDFANTRRGIYPEQLLFDVPFAAYAGNMPRFLLDAPRVLERIGARNHKDLPRDLDLASYPAYYRRNFHWQTDGYFSRHSAELYDLGVELLFIGTADVMRRQVLARVARDAGRGRLRLLDVGMGTGRFLRQAASCLPGAELSGVDLSPWYVGFARELLASTATKAGTAAPRVEVANAEALPFADGTFDVVTNIFVLHELPRHVRRRVVAEMQRVLAPGGLLVIEDAAQPSDAAELAPALAQFSEDMHEPFFADYQQDDVGLLLADAGFTGVSVTPAFVSKVVSGRKGLAQGADELLH